VGRSQETARARGGSSTVEPQPSKLMTRVRFPSAACLWRDVATSYKWDTLLLRNGMSINIWGVPASLLITQQRILGRAGALRPERLGHEAAPGESR
jgi:hypothetical protein